MPADATWIDFIEQEEVILKLKADSQNLNQQHLLLMQGVIGVSTLLCVLFWLVA